MTRARRPGAPRASTAEAFGRERFADLRPRATRAMNATRCGYGASGMRRKFDQFATANRYASATVKAPVR
ncbi:hypothetical protein VU09_12575 [Burkholderia pseudomallei]|nr:hypothetical protein VU09_12575 [Burkholderia pseudomallei]